MDRRLQLESLECRAMLTNFSASLLRDFSPGSDSSSFSNFHALDDVLLFNVGQNELWSTDGTQDGTLHLADTIIRSLFESRLYGPSEDGRGVRLFQATTDGVGDVWRTDGTPDGTFPLIPGRTIKDPAVDADSYALVTIAGIASTELWRVGKSSEDSWKLIDLAGSTASLDDAVVVEDTVYFSNDGTLFRTDGLVAGTGAIAEGISELNGNDEFASFFRSVGDTIHYYRVSPASDTPTMVMTLPAQSYLVRNLGARFAFLQRADPPELSQVWISDGTLDGTQPFGRLIDLLTHIVRFDDTVIFAQRYGYATITDGTLGGSSQPGALLGQIGNQIFFGHSDEITSYVFEGETAVHPAFPPDESLPSPAPGLPAPPIDAYWKFGDAFVKTQSTYLYDPRTPATYVVDAQGYLSLLQSTENSDLRIDVHYVGESWYAVREQQSSEGIVNPMTSHRGTIFPRGNVRILSDHDRPRSAPLFLELSHADAPETWAVDARGNFERIGEFAIGSSLQTHDDFFFTRPSEELGTEVWASDGTAEGIVSIDIMPGPVSSNPTFVPWNGAVLAIAETPAMGLELFVINGSFAETPHDGLRAEVGFFDIQEGHELALQASVHAPDASSPLTVQWDLNGDDDFSDALGQNPVVPWDRLRSLQANATEDYQPIQARVSDGDTTVTATGFLRIANVAPQILRFNVPSLVRAGNEIEIGVNVLDPVDQDQLQITMDFGDGSPVHVGSANPRHTFDRMGVYQIHVEVQDGDGGSAEATWELTVETAVPGGGGMFSPGQVFGENQSTVDLDAYDRNGDGHVDALFATYSDAISQRWDIDQQGQLTPSFDRVFSRSASNATVLGLISDDDRIDTIMATDNWLESGRRWHHVEFQVRSEDLALGDLNGDGLLDLFVANSEQADGIPAADMVLLLDPEKRTHFLSSDGREFVDTGQRLGEDKSRSVVLGDLDSDGDLDAVVAADSATHVWINDGQGRFRESLQQLVPGGNAVALGDLDGDDDLDLLVASDGANHVWFNTGDGQFLDSGQRLGNAHSSSLALGDLEGDGDFDAFVGNRLGDASTVWVNDGAGQFVDSAARIAPRADTRQVALVDLDRDGDLDAIVALAGAPNHVYFNTTIGGAKLTGDLNADSQVSFADFLILSMNFGKTVTGPSQGDLDVDGRVGFADFLILSANFGRSLNE